MNTQIITQKFFKDASGKIWCIDIMIMNQDSWESEIQEGWTAVSKDEADKIVNPPPTKAQLIEQAETQKQYLIAEVHAETQMLQTKLALKRIKPDELELLNAWLDYLDLLEAVDTSTAPDIDWPQKPQ
ncbi:TPA: tail fiber assembly protein [Morganella morganii]|nr:tail fiber assembly protein [Morganella morganii]MDU3447144.1 tail fiber assembly protein [Morganella morganii]MDU3504142.1 tail fiber assembly protein [Morganella morganii]HBL6944015.1 tail fiber assembly protein [Morganella morganii]